MKQVHACKVVCFLRKIKKRLRVSSCAPCAPALPPPARSAPPPQCSGPLQCASMLWSRLEGRQAVHYPPADYRRQPREKSTQARSSCVH
eukprot:1158431-Pelagomonas_calceolata.AAC.9